VANERSPRYGGLVQGDVVWSRRLADELWSGVVTPLTYSLLADVMAEHMVRRRLVHAGLEELSRRPVFRLERGYVYVNASLVADVMRELPAAVLSDGLLSLLPERLREAVKSGGRSTLSPRVLTTIVHLTLRERGWMPWSRADAFREQAETVARELAGFEAPEDLVPAEIAAQLADLRRRLGDYLEVVSWGMIYAYVFFYLTADLLERWGGGGQISGFLSRAAGIRTFEVHQELGTCAAAVRREPALVDALMSGEAAVVAERCLAGDLGELGGRFRALLERHGHRLTARDLAHPSWRERPASLIEMLRRLVQADPMPAALADGTADPAAEVALAKIASGISGPLRREIFRRCLAWCREYYAVRENMRYHADLFLAAMRGLALAGGRLLSRCGALADPEDVFFLTVGELSGALASGGAPTDAAAVRDRAALRRAEYDRFQLEIAPEVIVGDQGEPASARLAHAVRSLQGVGVSPGRAAGPARVVRTLEDLEAVRQGEVIVASSTDPSWTSLLSLGRGLVLEVGGMLSHGAIVARELGIPAVAAVARATALVKTGDRVTVDGGSGEVDIAVS
jgi:pyruvate,water dikinase